MVASDNNNEICVIKNSKKYVFEIANIAFDYENMIIMRKGCIYKLTKKEADLLMLFYLNKNNILTREFILKSIWGDDNYYMGRSMDVYISKLRKYLKFIKKISIETIHGTGFKLKVEEDI